MPIQAPQWTEFLSCPICCHMFDEKVHRPISLACGHTVCKSCLVQLPAQKKCPFDQTLITRSVDDLPVNFALLQLVGVAVPPEDQYNVDPEADLAEHIHNYTTAKRCIEELAIFLKPLPQAAAVNASSSSSAITSSTITSTSSSSSSSSSPPIILSRPMQRKLVLLVNCQLMEEEGRTRAVKASRSLGERAATELIVLHQNPQQLSANLWAGVRARGCQFLGPAMQEEVLRLILLALEDGSALSRKVLVLFVVQRLETQYPQASKTAIGHVVQLLYRASCFKVTKREDESSLMQFKDEFRTYDALRREHDSQIVQIATEAGLRISPEQWSSLLYGDTAHKSHMQSIIDKLQTPQSFGQSITELSLALQRTGDPGNLAELTPHLELLANVDPNADNPWESWPHLQQVLESVVAVVRGLIAFTGLRARKPLPQEYAYPPPFNAIPTSSTPISSPTPGQPLTPHSAKYKTSMCRDLTLRGQCPRGNSCTFAHSHDEMSRFRQRSKKLLLMPGAGVVAASSLASIYPSPCHTPETSMCDNMSPQSTAALLHALQMSLSHSMASVSKPKPTMAVSQPQMATKTQISSQPNKPIMSVAVRMAGVEKHNVNVPIARPSTLPGSTKQLLHKESIYTSPTLVETKGGPNIMPIHQKAPQQQGERGPGGPGGPPGQHRLLTGQQNHQEPTAQHSNNHQQEDEAFMRNTMALPPNPYTTRAGAPPSNPTVQVKTSMKQQLGELERRRDELLSKLNRHDRSQPQITCTTASASTSPLPASTLAALSTVIVLTQELMNKQGSSSVADSMATTCTMMSLADSGARNRRSPVVSSSPVTSQYSNSAPSSSVSSSSSSISSSSSVFTSMSSPHLFTTQYSSLTSRGEAVVRSSPSHSVPENWSNTFLEQTDILLLNDQGDEYVPMKHTTVSKYGPISRGGRAKERLNGVAPVNVIAGQIGDMIPVMAVTPNMHHTGNQHEEPTTIWRAGPPLPPQHIAPPRMNMGVTIASSLPTALMKPHVIAAATATENTPGAGLEAPQSLWALKEKMLSNMSDKNPHSHADQTKIHADLCCVSKQIKNLQASEEERMTRELQSIELNIKETQRRVSDREQQDFLLAREEQNYELAVEQEKAVQEAYDMHLAQKLALQEASDAVMRTNNVQQQH